MIISFIFDSGNLGSSSYGNVVFKHMLKDKELMENSKKVIVSLGDILINKSFVDIEPYIVNNRYCTISNNTIDTYRFKDYPYCWIVEDIDYEIAMRIDSRLKTELEGYIGFFKINLELTSKSKQFWKDLIRKFALENEKIISFQNPDEDLFLYNDSALQMGYKVEYEKYAEFSEIEDLKSIQSSEIRENRDLEHKDFNIRTDKGHNLDRDIIDLNFSLCYELSVAGSFIWKSIIELEKITIHNVSKQVFSESPFLTLYFASQGIERLQKIIIELICKKEHFQEEEKNQAFEILMGHKHTSLNDWILSNSNICFKCDNKFLLIFQEFYNKLRYRRFYDNDNLCPEIDLIASVQNDNEKDLETIKSCFGKKLGTISNEYYRVISELCQNLNIFSYEIGSYTAAECVFRCQEKDNNLYKSLKHITQAKKEVLYWMMKN